MTIRHGHVECDDFGCETRELMVDMHVPDGWTGGTTPRSRDRVHFCPDHKRTR